VVKVKGLKAVWVFLSVLGCLGVTVKGLMGYYYYYYY